MSFELRISQKDGEQLDFSALEKLTDLYSNLYPGLFCVVEVQLASMTEIAALNAQYRNLNEPTDVLSFPTLLNMEAIRKSAEQIPTLLGSIVICPEKAVMYKEELLDLVHHGLLHLLGFDHETEGVEWEAEEKKVLTLATASGLRLKGIPHDAI